GKARTQAIIVGQPLLQTVETLSDRFAGKEGERSRAKVDLDSRNRACGLNQLDESRPVARRLLYGFLEKDHARDTSFERVLRAKQQFAIVAARFLSRSDADGRKALRDGPAALIRGEDPLTRGHQCLCRSSKSIPIHHCLRRRYSRA